MPNALTGSFDIVAEFSPQAVNRLLSGMHAIRRFPHSISLRVEDIPAAGGVRPVVTEVVDARGDSVFEMAPMSSAPDMAGSGRPPSLDAIVNLDELVNEIPPVVPSRLRGRAQIQLAPPTLEIVDAALSRVLVRIPIRARYHSEPASPRLAEFARGELHITTTVKQVTSQAGSVVDIDLRSSGVQSRFVPSWSSAPLSAEDRAAIDLLIGNALKTSALPSNTPLPSTVSAMAFSALVDGAARAVAVLINTDTPAGQVGSVTRVFLGPSDFAFAVGAETVLRSVESTRTRILQTQIPSFRVPLPWVRDPTYTVTITDARFTLESGRILMTVTGRATTPAWYAPNFGFTVKQAFHLVPAGTTGELAVGDLSITADSWIANRFIGRARPRFETARDRALTDSGVQATVGRMLDTNRNLGGFFRSLLTPARSSGQPEPQPRSATMTYTSADITPDGVLLRGNFEVPEPPEVHVEFAETARPPSPAALPGSGPEYSGFRSWIPGGGIDRFTWKRSNQTQGTTIENTFVFAPEGPGLSADIDTAAGTPTPFHGFSAMCLSIRGTRLSATGPVRSEVIGSAYCAFPWFPLLDAVAPTEGAEALLVPLVRPGAQGLVEVVGHAPALRKDRSSQRPNLVVHFGDERSLGALPRLLDAVNDSRRHDAVTAVVAVVGSRWLERQQYVPGVTYVTEDQREWERLWRLTLEQRPSTVVLAPNGRVLWSQRGPIDTSDLAATLRRVLRPTQMGRVAPVEVPAVPIGHVPPNFVFTHAAGSELTLRKLIGRRVVIVFWRRDATVSVRSLAALATASTARGAVVLAVCDGDSAEAQPSEQSMAPGVVHVADPERSISRAYGVSAWPTIVAIDDRGRVHEVRHGQATDAGFAADVADAVHAR